MRAPKLTPSSMAIGVAGLLVSAGLFLWTTAPRGGCPTMRKPAEAPPRIQAHPAVDGKAPCPMMKARRAETYLRRHHD